VLNQLLLQTSLRISVGDFYVDSMPFSCCGAGLLPKGEESCYFELKHFNQELHRITSRSPCTEKRSRFHHITSNRYFLFALIFFCFVLDNLVC